MIRQGTCRNCGQCCGAPGSPYQDSPWPDNWPEAVRNWQIDYLANTFPIFKTTGHPILGGANAGAVRIGNKTYRWIWVPGHGLCADAPPYGNTSTYYEMCPLLGLQQPDGTYPCAVMGTAFEEIVTKLGCRWLPEEWDERSIEEWQTNHPKCGFWYE